MKYLFNILILLYCFNLYSDKANEYFFKDFLAPVASQEYSRELNHLAVLNEIGFNFKASDIRNMGYDRFGYFVFEKKLNDGSGWVTLKFANSVPFDIDGDIDYLINYLQNEIAQGKEKPENEERKALLRYYVFKRLVKFRQNARPYLPLLWGYLNQDIEPSKMVRDEVQVAIRMIGFDAGTIKPEGSRLNISFISYEAAPLVKKGGLGDVNGTLPRVIHNKGGHNCDVYMPYWSLIDDVLAKNPDIQIRKVEEIEPFYVDKYKHEIYEVIIDNTPIRLLKCDELYKVEGMDAEKTLSKKELSKKRGEIYQPHLDIMQAKTQKKRYEKGEISLDEYGRTKYRIHSENAERAIIFSRAAVIAMQKIGKLNNTKPDIVNTSDWQTALVPALVKQENNDTQNTFFQNTKLAHSIHNFAFKGTFAPDLWYKTTLNEKYYSSQNHMDGEFWGNASLMKLGIVNCDALVTVSPQYAKELQTAEYGHSLEGLIKLKNPVGIVNGIAQREFTPEIANGFVPMMLNPTEADKKLGVKEFIEGKKTNKEKLQKRYGLINRGEERIPLFTYVARLQAQKGLDALIPVIEKILSEQKGQFLMVGEGDAAYEEKMREFEKKYPGNFKWISGFITEPEVKQIMAGSDLLQMPSMFEPCGITQLQAMRFGVIPIVNYVGGLVNTVFDFIKEKLNVDVIPNGYVVYDGLTTEKLLETTLRAIDDYQNIDSWNEKVRNEYAQSSRFIWAESSTKYEELFYRLVGFNPQKYMPHSRSVLSAA